MWCAESLVLSTSLCACHQAATTLQHSTHGWRLYIAALQTVVSRSGRRHDGWPCGLPRSQKQTKDLRSSRQAASEGGHGAEQDAANWQLASTFYRQFDGAVEAPAAHRVPAVLSTLAAVPLPGICGASWIPYDACPPEGLGPSPNEGPPPARELMSDGAPAGDSDAFTFPQLPLEERHQLRAACRREAADSYCTAWNQSLRPVRVTMLLPWHILAVSGDLRIDPACLAIMLAAPALPPQSCTSFSAAFPSNAMTTSTRPQSALVSSESCFPRA
jgi:hypothetical protein